MMDVWLRNQEINQCWIGVPCYEIINIILASSVLMVAIQQTAASQIQIRTVPRISASK